MDSTSKTFRCRWSALTFPAAAKDPRRFPDLKLHFAPEEFRGWAKTQKDHFADGRIFDPLYQK